MISSVNNNNLDLCIFDDGVLRANGKNGIFLFHFFLVLFLLFNVFHTKWFLMKEFHPKMLEAFFYGQTIVIMCFLVTFESFI